MMIIAGKKLTKCPNFTRFCPKNARLHNKTTRSRPGRGQMSEAKAEAKASRPRSKFWPQGHFGLQDLTSLQFFLHNLKKSYWWYL